MAPTITEVVKMAKIEDRILEHSYDGIREYDNPLPGWWLYLFILTIIWAFSYMYYYHVANIGPGQDVEYTQEMAKFQLAFEDIPADLAPLTDDASINEGSEIFKKNCLICHGPEGQGGVGPNMTDEYWIHGGRYEDMVRTTQNGVPEKGMISWKMMMPNDQILKVTSFLMTLRGTNPPNPKAPQGELYVEQEAEEAEVSEERISEETKAAAATDIIDTNSETGDIPAVDSLGADNLGTDNLDTDNK